MTSVTTDLIIRRALSAYTRTDGEPLPTSTTIERHGSLRYVVLRRSRALLACYRIRNDDKLKRLIRLPVSLR